MRQHVRLQRVALVAVLTLGLAGCVAVNEALTERDITCQDMPDELCLRIADIVVDAAPGEISTERATVTSLQVGPADCVEFDRTLPATRCWWVSGTYVVGYADIPLTSEIQPTDTGLMLVYERLDGTIVVWQ